MGDLEDTTGEYPFDGRLFAIEPVYWAGILIADGADVGGDTDDIMIQRCR